MWLETGMENGDSQVADGTGLERVAGPSTFLLCEEKVEGPGAAGKNRQECPSEGGKWSTRKSREVQEGWWRHSQYQEGRVESFQGVM